MKQNIIIGALLLVIGIVLGLLVCRSCSTPEEVEIVQTDTVVVRDTIREYYPVETERKVVDTMRIVVRDTIRMKDTLYVSIPLEKKIYASSEYYAEISGYRPSLDYIEVFPKTTIIKECRTESVTKRHGLELGIEASYSTIFSLPLHLEYSYGLTKWLDVYGYAEYELLRKQFAVGAGTKIGIEW